MGILKSAAIPEHQTPPNALIHSSIQDAISFLVFGLLLFIFSWPKIVTYLFFVLILKSIVNLFLAYLGVGRYGIPDLTKKGKTQQLLLETVPVLIYFIATWASVHFLGW